MRGKAINKQILACGDDDNKKELLVRHNNQEEREKHSTLSEN